MSQLISIPGSSFMSELIQPAWGCSPHPQLSLRIPSGGAAAGISCGWEEGLVTEPQATPSFSSSRRILNVGPIAKRVRGDLARIADRPAARAKQLDVGRIRLVDVEGDLERRRDSPG